MTEVEPLERNDLSWRCSIRWLHSGARFLQGTYLSLTTSRIAPAGSAGGQPYRHCLAPQPSCPACFSLWLYAPGRRLLARIAITHGYLFRAFFHKNTRREMSARRASYSLAPTFQQEMALMRIPSFDAVGSRAEDLLQSACRNRLSAGPAWAPASSLFFTVSVLAVRRLSVPCTNIFKHQEENFCNDNAETSA